MKSRIWFYLSLAITFLLILSIFSNIFAQQIDVGKGVDAAGDVGKSSGRLGGPAHQQTIKDVANEIKNQGGSIISGGGGSEKRVIVDPITGKYRYPDIQASIDGQDVYINVGKTKVSGEKVTREFNAITDLSKLPGNTKFVPYDKPFDITSFVGGLR